MKVEMLLFSVEANQLGKCWSQIVEFNLGWGSPIMRDATPHHATPTSVREFRDYYIWFSILYIRLYAKHRGVNTECECVYTLTFPQHPWCVWKCLIMMKYVICAAFACVSMCFNKHTQRIANIGQSLALALDPTVGWVGANRAYRETFRNAKHKLTRTLTHTEYIYATFAIR